jgi:hypothetical protein
LGAAQTGNPQGNVCNTILSCPQTILPPNCSALHYNQKAQAERLDMALLVWESEAVLVWESEVVGTPLHIDGNTTPSLDPSILFANRSGPHCNHKAQVLVLAAALGPETQSVQELELVGMPLHKLNNNTFSSGPTIPAICRHLRYNHRAQALGLV